MGIDARGRWPKTSGVKIHLNRAGQSLGTFTPAEVRAGYDSGKFLPGDLAWHDGMDSWKPLGEVIAELAPAPGEAAPGAVVPAPQHPQGIAWERRQEIGFLNGLLETIRGVLLEPTATFAGMQKTGGLAAPLFFYVFLGSIALLVTFFYQFVFQSMGMVASEGDKEVFAALFGSAVAMGLIIVFAPLMVAAGAFIGSAITHLMLMIVGGANRPFEATFRVMCYAGGSTAVLQLVPVCGAWVASIWMIVAQVIGLSEVHGITKMRAAVAVLLPLVLCCGLAIAVFVIAFGVGMGAAFSK